MADIAYETVDVFTTTRFGGNPLAVILDGRDLSDTQMQQVAAEFGYSETTFVLPPSDPQNTARVRIFTPTFEMPFAGHPNVGTAFVLARQGSVFGRPIGETMRFEEIAGIVDVSVLRNDGVVTGAAITAPRRLEIGLEIPVEHIAACASLTESDIVTSRHAPRMISVGATFVVAELTSRAALAQAKPNPVAFTEANAASPQPDGVFALFLYVPTPEGPHQLSARMFAPLDNIPEDPATGSASAALAAYHLALVPEPEAESTLTLEQGVDMGRPSLIRLKAYKTGGTVYRVVVAGECVPVMRGVLLV